MAKHIDTVHGRVELNSAADHEAGANARGQDEGPASCPDDQITYRWDKQVQDQDSIFMLNLDISIISCEIV